MEHHFFLETTFKKADNLVAAQQPAWLLPRFVNRLAKRTLRVSHALVTVIPLKHSSICELRLRKTLADLLHAGAYSSN